MKTRYHYNLRAMVLILVIAELVLNALPALFYFVFRKHLTGLKLDNEWLLLGLVAGPLLTLIFIFFIRWKNRALERFGDTNLLPYFAQPLSSQKYLVKFLMYRLAFTLVVIGLVNPKIGSKVAEGKTQGIDIMFCLDVSNSMLAEDIKPSRLTRAKRGLEQIIDQLHGHRIGVIVFAGEAYVQLPLTTDYGAAKLFMDNIEPDLVPVQGTSIGKAINLAIQSFDFEKQREGKAIVVITDGENHEDDALAAAQQAADNKVPVYCIGIGTAQGAPIPVYEGSRRVDYKKDENGQVVVTRLNEEEMAKVATAGKGVYVSATTQDAGLETVMAELDKQTRTELDSVVYVDYEDRFQWFVAAALILLLIETVQTEKRSRWVDKINWFNAE